MELSVLAVIVAAGTFGAAAVVPYAFDLNAEQIAKAPLPKSKLMLISVVQGAILVLIASLVGLLLGAEIGLGAPIIEGLLKGEGLPAGFGTVLLMSIVLGAISAVVIVLLDRVVFLPRLPETFRKVTGKIALWKRALAGFYGGITEEILMRLFLMTLIIWLTGKVWTAAAGLPADGAYWFGIVLAALIFGAGHLPATRALGPLTPLVIIRALLLNAVLGIVAGILFWQYGLLPAMIAHFSADMVLHVIAPLFTRSEPDTANSTTSSPLNSAV